MHPAIIFGAFVLVRHLLDQERQVVLREAESEKRRLDRVDAHRTKAAKETRKRAIGLAVVATKKMIAALKAERRAAAEARGRLPWGSPDRERAHELVLLLNQRIDTLYAKKQALHADNPA